MHATIRFAAIATLGMVVATAGPVASQTTTQRMQPPPAQLPAPRSGQPVDPGPQSLPPVMTVMFQGPGLLCLGAPPRLVSAMPPKLVLEKGSPLTLAQCGVLGTRWALPEGGKGGGTVRVADHVPPLCLSVSDLKGPLVVADCMGNVDKGSMAQMWVFQKATQGTPVPMLGIQAPTKGTVQIVSKFGCVVVKTPGGAMPLPQIMLGGCNEAFANWMVVK